MEEKQASSEKKLTLFFLNKQLVVNYFIFLYIFKRFETYINSWKHNAKC